MSKMSIFIVLLTLFFLSVIWTFSACKNEQPSLETTLFDGKSFDGWEGSKDFFRIAENAIVAGSSEKKIPHNQFLCTNNSYSNFELTLKVKFNSTVNNAGVQFRSKRIPNNHEVIGYQADVGFIENLPIWGSLYDESRRNRFLQRGDSLLVVQTLKPDGWNEYRIRCEASQINFWLNEIPILEYMEEDEGIADDGVICLQIHGGERAEAWYKDIVIKDL